MNLDITFSDDILADVPDGGRVQAGWLLTVLPGDEDALETVTEKMEQRHIALDISDLPTQEPVGEAAVRLRRESELVRKGTLLTALEETDPLRLYLEELAMIPAAGDPNVLAMELAAGNTDVAERLVNLYLHRVVELAMAYTGHGVLLLDLIQEASLGLWQGILGYSGGDISAHCDWWINQYLSKTVLQQALTGGLGQKLRQGMKDYVDVDQKLLTDLGRNPTLEEIAEAMHITADDAAVYADMVRSAKSRRQVEAEREPAEPTADDEQAVEDTAYFQSRQRILELLSALTEQEAQLISLRYGLEGGLPLSPEQVGAKLGITPEEVVNMEAAALNKLRQDS